MPGFRARRMTVEQWSSFKTAFEKLFMASGAERKLALFLEWQQPGEDPLVLIPDYLSNSIEQLAPGEWHALSDAIDRRWTVLVGNETALGDFGLNLAGPSLDYR